MQCLGLQNSRYLSTKELTADEKKNRTMDYLGGFELIDKEMRMYVFEGVGGEGKSMHQFYQINEREHSNDRRFKMIFNPELTFKHRLYQSFNVAIKKIKLRDSLTRLMSEPDIYLRSKVPQDMYDTLQKFAEIRKLDRATLVRDFNLYPVAAHLLTLERKYGDSLTNYDLTGQKPKRRRVPRPDGSTQNSETVSMSYETRTRLSNDDDTFTQSKSGASALASKPPPVVYEESSEEEDRIVRDTTKRKADTVCQNPTFLKSLREREMCQSQDFMKSNIHQLKMMSSGRLPQARIDLPQGVDVYPYSCQKLNIWEFQKEQLRKTISNDAHNFYTYSKEHLSLAFPRVNENELAQNEKQQNQSAWKTKNGFDTKQKPD